jgi:hypothetical protein
MLIAGIEVPPPHIVWLADKLISEGNLGTADALLHADADAMHSVALTALDREALLQVLRLARGTRRASRRTSGSSPLARLRSE